MSGSGKGVSGVVGISRNGSGAGTFPDTLAGPEREQWHHVILEELAAIKDAGTWDLVDPSPQIRNVVGCRFVLVKKRGANGEVTKFKA